MRRKACVCQIFSRAWDPHPSRFFSPPRNAPTRPLGERDSCGHEHTKTSKSTKNNKRARRSKKHTFFHSLNTMFALSSKTSATPAFVAVKKRQQNSRVVRATTKAVVNDSPRIIVENDAETKKFRLRDHQREVIRDMSGFAGGEVRIIYTRVLFTPPSFSSTKRFQNSSSVCDRRVLCD